MAEFLHIKEILVRNFELFINVGRLAGAVGGVVGDSMGSIFDAIKDARGFTIDKRKVLPEESIKNIITFAFGRAVLTLYDRGEEVDVVTLSAQLEYRDDCANYFNRRVLEATNKITASA